MARAMARAVVAALALTGADLASNPSGAQPTAPGPPGGIPLVNSIPGRHARLGSALLQAGGRGLLDNHAPGPVTIATAIDVAVDERGRPVGGRLRQDLTLDGVGDYVLEIPEEADNAATPEGGSDEQGAPSRPGLRDGTIVWEGFSPGRRQLAAVADLGPDSVSSRFPVRLAITPSAAGTGPDPVTVTIANATTLPVPVVDGTPDAAALATALAAARAELAAGRFPRAGSAGVPLAIPGAVGANASVPVTAFVAVAGEVRFMDGPRPAIGTLGEGQQIELAGAGPATLHLTLAFVPPPPETLAADLRTEDGRRQGLRALQTVLATGLRVRDFGPYVPGVDRAATPTGFTVRLALPAPPAPRPPPKPEADGRTVALALLGALGLAAVTTTVWRRS